MTQWDGSDTELTAVGAILRDYMMGKIKLSKQSLRELEKQLEKSRKIAERRDKPEAKRPGHRMKLRKIWRKGQRKWREKNPDYEYTLNRRYTRLLKHCREKGVECTLTLAEYEVLMDQFAVANARAGTREGVTPEDSRKGEGVRIVRKDLSKGFTAENSVVIPESKYFKLLALRRKQRAD